MRSRLEETADLVCLLFSLHGMEPNRAQDHFLTEDPGRLNRLTLAAPSKRSTEAGLVQRHGLSALGLAADAAISRRQPARRGVQDWVVNRALIAGRDWAATPSIPILSGGEGLIRLNVKGRECNGFFEPGSAELADYVDWLCDRLSAIQVAETGETLIQTISRIDESCRGRRDFLPDLVIEWAPDAPVDRISSPDIGEIEVSLATGRGGNHNDRAFLIAQGTDPFLREAASVADISGLGNIAERYLQDR